MVNIHISVISPIYGCKTSLIELYHRLNDALSKVTQEFEIILVDDRAYDQPWSTIEELHNKDKRVKGIKLSKNHGQHKAITAGLSKAKGEWIVVMDCDLQDRPEEIINLYNKAIETNSYQVLGRRKIRQDKFIKRQASKVFYRVLGYLTDTEQDSSIANFGIYHRKVVDAILSMNDSFRYLPTMAYWVGFKRTTLDIEHSERLYGETGYSFKALLRLALDVILAFSEKPLKLVMKLGIAISLASLFFTAITIIRYFSGDITVLGYASLMLSIWFLGGIIIFIIGMTGLYIGKIFERVKNRPTFIIEELLD